MTRIFVDTSAWFALCYARDPAHPDVKAVYDEAGHQWFTSNYVLDETLTLLESRAGHPNAVRAGHALRGGRQAELIRVDPEDEEQAWGIFQSMSGFSFTDCTSFVLMRRHRIDTVLGLDRDFRKQGFLLVPK